LKVFWRRREKEFANVVFDRLVHENIPDLRDLSNHDSPPEKTICCAAAQPAIGGNDLFGMHTLARHAIAGLGFPDWIFDYQSHSKVAEPNTEGDGVVCRTSKPEDGNRGAAACDK
jgi:hypothetical protein